MTLLPDLPAMPSTRLPETAFARTGEKLDAAKPSDPTFASFLETLDNGENPEKDMEVAAEDIDDNQPATSAEDGMADADEESKKPMPAVDFMQEKLLASERGGDEIQAPRMSTLLPLDDGALELEVKTPPQHQKPLESGGSYDAETPIDAAGRIAQAPVRSAAVPPVALQAFTQFKTRLPTPDAHLTESQLNQVGPTLKTRDPKPHISVLSNGRDSIANDAITPQSEKSLDYFTNEPRFGAQLTADSLTPSTKAQSPASSGASSNLTANLEHIARESVSAFSQASDLLNGVPIARSSVSTTPAIDEKSAKNERFDALSNDATSLPRDSERLEVPKALPIERTTSLQSQISSSVSAPLAARDLGGHDGPSLKEHFQEIGSLTPLKSEQTQFTPQATLQSPTPKVLPAGNAQAITDAVLTLRDTGGKIDVTLSPEDLGRLTIKLDQTAHGNHFTLSAERGDVQDLIRRQLEQLQSEFLSMGFENATFAFENQNNGQNETENMRSDQGNIQAATSDAFIEQHQFAPSSGVDIRI